ncbi:MAG: Fic family protein [Candidatus Woesearchaeota archaeon]
MYSKFKFNLTQKDILAINEKFEDGRIHNEASLDFALSYAKKTENWIKALAYLTRAILIDHVFEDGNKRTAALLIESYAEYEGHQTYPDKVPLLIKKLLLKNTISLRKIEEMIKDVIR